MRVSGKIKGLMPQIGCHRSGTYIKCTCALSVECTDTACDNLTKKMHAYNCKISYCRYHE